MSRILSVTLGPLIVAIVATVSLVGAPSTAQAGLPRGYIVDAKLKQSASNSSKTLARITFQWVEIRCWKDAGGIRWFYVQYYSQRGYVEANLVGRPPTVGRC